MVQVIDVDEGFNEDWLRFGHYDVDRSGNPIYPKRKAVLVEGGAGSGHHGHTGVEGQVGGSAPGEGGAEVERRRAANRERVRAHRARKRAEAEAAQAPVHVRMLQAKEAEIRALPTERGYAVASDGKVLIDKGGTVDRVPMNEAEIALVRGAHFTHNHPSGNSFSPDDVRFLATNGLASIRATGTTPLGETWLYVMEPDGPISAEERDRISSDIYVQDAAVYNAFRPQVNSGTLSVAEANASHHHQLWTQVSAIVEARRSGATDGGYTTLGYRRERIG